MPQKLKVAIVTHFPKDPMAPKGGVEAVCVNLAKSLSNFDDLEIHVITLDAYCHTITRASCGAIIVHYLPRPKGSMLRTAIGSGKRLIFSYLQKLSVDVIHSHDTYGIMVKGFRSPKVFTIHGFIYADLLVSGKKWAWIRSKIWRWIEIDGWKDQPHIISISPYVRERLNGIATGVIHDIDNPISDSFFKIKRHEKKTSIFSAAAICPRKNTLALINAFSQLISEGLDIELRLAGEVYEPNYGRIVEQRIASEDLKGKVKLLGRINSQQVMEELSSASIFALASLEENSPMGIEEAMAAGVPVVTSNRCGMPYLVRDGESGFLVNPTDTRDIARRLRLLLQNDGLRHSMGKRSRAIALERFHPEKIARRTREVYYDAFHSGADQHRLYDS